MPFQAKITIMTTKKVFIFDLDGVIVDTIIILAWQNSN
jgi:hypothetical protein